jgi:hypothetical protein
MSNMPGLCRVRVTVLSLLAVALGLTVACSRPLDAPSDPAATTAEQAQAPFREAGDQSAITDLPRMGAEHHPASHTPGGFPESQSLPAGTLVTVQLKNAVYASGSIVSTAFQAVVVEPIVVKGTTVIPAGATAEGRVEAARSSKIKPNRGYVRLALESVELSGLDVPVQTASLFARQSPSGDESANSIHLEKGRRLTFRFTEAISPNNRTAQNLH